VLAHIARARALAAAALLLLGVVPAAHLHTPRRFVTIRRATRTSTRRAGGILGTSIMRGRYGNVHTEREKKSPQTRARKRKEENNT
jgi:hypothetical protein